MKTYKQWCEQTGKDPLADELSLITQNAIKQGKNPKADVDKALADQAVKAQSTGDSDKAAKVANAATKVNLDAATKPKMKKKMKKK